MTSLNALFNEGRRVPTIPTELIDSFSYIAVDPKIRSGWPHIVNTRILATDIFKAQVKGITHESLLADFKDLGVKIDKKALEEAFIFTLRWMHYLDEKETSKASH